MTAIPSIEKQAERLLAAFNSIMRNLRLIHPTGKERIELTKPQMITLMYVVQKNGCKMSVLSKLTGMALSALTGIVDRLLEKGLVKRESNSEDRRIVKVVATEEGSSIANEYYQNYLNMIKQLLSKIEDTEREQFVSLFEKVARSL